MWVWVLTMLSCICSVWHGPISFNGHNYAMFHRISGSLTSKLISPKVAVTCLTWISSRLSADKTRSVPLCNYIVGASVALDLFWFVTLHHVAPGLRCHCFARVFAVRRTGPAANALMYVFQAGWKENHATFMCELKNLQASGLTTLGHALRTAFDLLNLNRLVSGIDNYGQVCDTGILSVHVFFCCNKRTEQ